MQNKSTYNIISRPVFRTMLALFILACLLVAQPMTTSCAKPKTGTLHMKGKVKKLKKMKVTSHSIKLKWRKFKGAAGYQIYQAATKNGVYRKVSTTRKNYVTRKKLIPGKTYYYKVRAFQSVKKKKRYSRFSAVLKVKTKAAKQKQPDTKQAVTNTPADGSPTDNTPPTSNPDTSTAANTPENKPADTAKKYFQQLNYQESTVQINNPDQGFYRPIYVRVTEDGVSYNKNIVNDATQLYHLRIDISAFSEANNGTADIELTENALSGIDELLSFLYEKNKSAIARFVYDPGLNGASNKEPSLEMMIRHITQLSEILENYHDTLTAVETGLIGPWGEMHTSTMANKESICALVDCYLKNTTDIPILVRTPQMIYNYLGISLTDIDTYRIDSTADAYRLGLYNDGYLGSSSDLGTYTNREKEVPWLALQNDHLPYGGEVVIPGSTLHDIENCLDEMFLLHLSYLNIEWNNTVINKWKETYYTDAAGRDSLYYGKTAFQYIENHMGYRFVLESSTLEYDTAMSHLGIELSLNNVGFGNLNRTLNMELLLQNEEGELTSIDAGQFNGQEKIVFQTDLELEKETYKVYIKLSKGNNRYALQFANDLWDEELQANLIGSLT